MKDEETVPPDGASLTLRPIKRWPTGDDRQFEGNFIAGCLISVSLGRCVMSANRLAELQLGGSSADPHANDIHDGLAGSCISMFAGHRPWPPSNESEKPAPSTTNCSTSWWRRWRRGSRWISIQDASCTPSRDKGLSLLISCCLARNLG